MAEMVPPALLIVIVLATAWAIWPRRARPCDAFDQGEGRAELDWPKRPDPADAKDAARRVN